jgi:hypothetical protein
MGRSKLKTTIGNHPFTFEKWSLYICATSSQWFPYLNFFTTLVNTYDFVMESAFYINVLCFMLDVQNSPNDLQKAANMILIE